MKKIFLVLAVIALISTTNMTGSANSAKFQNANTISKVPPEAVIVSFDYVVSDIMRWCFPENQAYDATGVSWEKDQAIWSATGIIKQVNGNGTITIQVGQFTKDGEIVSFITHVQ